MKFALCSDVHLEFGGISLENTENADVLILSGDICVAKDIMERDVYEISQNKKSDGVHTFFQECCARFPRVVYVLGNHEHYHGDFSKSVGIIRDRFRYLTNLHVLDVDYIQFGDVHIVGGTLWTDMNKEDPLTISHIKGYMNDYRLVEDSSEVVHYKTPVYGRREDGSVDYENIVSMEFHTRNAKFSPEKSVSEHKKTLQFFKDRVESKPNEKWVVVGHHAPSKLSTKPQYERDVVVNGAYSSDLSEFILDHPQIKVWTHGHTHNNFDYMIGSTRILANPRGYVGYEDQADFFKLQYFEV
jgi:predicted phosphodiesterase